MDDTAKGFLARPTSSDVNNIVIWRLLGLIKNESSLRLEKAILRYLAQNIRRQQS